MFQSWEFDTGVVLADGTVRMHSAEQQASVAAAAGAEGSSLFRLSCKLFWRMPEPYDVTLRIRNLPPSLHRHGVTAAFLNAAGYDDAEASVVCEYYRPLQLEAGAAEFSEHSIADAGSVYARVHATEADPFLARVVGAYTLPEHPGVVRITVQHHRVHRLLGDAAARGPLRAPALVRMMQPSCLGEYDPFQQVPVSSPAAAAAGAGRDGGSTPPAPRLAARLRPACGHSGHSSWGMQQQTSS